MQVLPRQFSSRYDILEPLGSGGMGIVYKAQDRLNHQFIALKHVHLDKATDSSSSSITEAEVRMALIQEFKTLASLRHPHIVSVLDYGFDRQGQPFFTMELIEALQTITVEGHQRPLSVQVAYLVQLLQALAYLHRRGIIHRDLKPDNVVIDSNHRVKVLDFGLAVTNEQKRESVNTAGTLKYIAPEVLSHNYYHQTSDIYAIGMIAYEMFAGRHPYEGVHDQTALMYRILESSPDVSHLPLSTELAVVIGKMLARNYEDRYQNANEALRALSEAAQVEVPLETIDTRESFLRAAAFIGRDQEISILKESLEKTKKGQGVIWFIGGESGSGKSRLSSELRIHALVQGFQVIRGQGIQEIGEPFLSWHNTIRWLALSIEIDDLEASILKSLIPDIGELLEREIPDPAHVSTQAQQNQIQNVIVDLLHRYGQSYEQPLMILLDDMHWAGSESIRVLEAIGNFIDRLPILILITYRDDEAPELKGTITNAQEILLKPLTESEIVHLSSAILGQISRLPEVLGLLKAETDGNIYHIIELIRTLGEDAGRLSLIGLRTIPASQFSGGLNKIIQRRIGMVPEMMQPLLYHAALAGRRLDIALLDYIHQQSPQKMLFKMTDWLAQCEELTVIEVQEEQWRFGHDQLREGIIRSLSPTEKQLYHQHIAEAIEVLYAGQPLSYHSLAYHWRYAEQVQKEALYSYLAGELSLDNGAYQEAIQLLQRAAEHDQASSLNVFDKARLQRLISATYIAIGDFDKSLKHLRLALALFGYPLPDEDSKIKQEVLKQFLRQTAHRTLSFAFMGNSQHEHERMIECARAYEQVSEIGYYTNQSQLGILGALRTLNLAERTYPSSELARAYGSVSYISMLINERISEHYYKQARATVAKTNDAFAKARILQLSTLRDIMTGRWDVAIPAMEETIALYEGIGDYRLHITSMHTLGEIYYLIGEFDKSLENKKLVHELSIRRSMIQGQGFGLRGLAMNYAVKGQYEAALRAADGAVFMFRASHDLIGEMDAAGLYARASLGLEDRATAVQKVQDVIALGRGKALTSYNSIIALSNCADVVIQLLLEEPDAELKVMYEQLLKLLRDYKKRFPIGKACYPLYAGYGAYFNQTAGKADQVWLAGLRVAKGSGMPYQEANLHEALALHSYLSEAEKGEHELHARQVYTALNCEALFMR